MPIEAPVSQIDPQVFQQTVDKKLADLPPLPAVVVRIMETVNDPNTCADDLNRLISLDQGLSSKMLRIVNSAYYGFPKRISTITQAVVILGFNTVRNLVLGVSAFGVLADKKGETGLDRTRFWEHSVAAAVAAGILAKKQMPRNRALVELAFLAGLLHDVGELFLDCYFPAQHAATLQIAREEQIPMVLAERKLLGIDHVQIGQRISEVWNFPTALVAALGCWFDPMTAGEDFFDLAAVVHAAESLSCQAGFWPGGDLPTPVISQAVHEWLQFSDADYEAFLENLQNQFGAARDMLGLAEAA